MKKFTPLLLIALAFSAFTSNSQTTVTFNYTGAMQTFTVPPCVTSLTVDVIGAKGGDLNTAIGGNGGRTQCTFPVTPGEVLNIYVGGLGANGDNITGVIAGGFNGGGTGFDNTDPWGGGGGGGGSDIRRTPFSLNDRLVVGGGGGAGGVDGCGAALLNGGAGGGLVGAPGQIPMSCVGSGQGGTQTAGGLKGQYPSCTNLSTDGSFGIGGIGYGNCGNSDEGGSGGGGGWYGGGGGNFGAGGGGSSYTDGSCTGVVHTQGFQTGAGFVSITYTAGTGVPNQPGTITGSVQVCAGATVTYSISTVVGATSYSWTVPTGATINSGNGTTTISVTFGTTSGNITVTANNACGASTAQTLAVTVSNPVLSLTPTATTCFGSCDGSISANTTGGISPYTYSPTLTNLCAGPYTVIVTDNIGCTATQVATVTSPTQININMPSGADICPNACATIPATVTGGTPPYSYVWMPGNMTTSSVTVCPTTSSIYTLTVTDANACTNTGTSMINVYANVIAVASTNDDTICVGGSVNLAATGGVSYNWAPGTGLSCTTCANPVANPTVTTCYTVTATSGNGCTGVDSVCIDVETCTGIDNASAISLTISIYPNPFNELLNVKANASGEMELFNILGEEIGRWKMETGENKINVSNLPSGVYFVTVKTDVGSITKKVIKE